MKNNRYSKALKILKSTEVDDKIKNLNEMPTNHTKGVYSLNDPGFNVGPITHPQKIYYPDIDGNWPEGIPGTPGELEYVRPAGYWSGGSDWDSQVSTDFSQNYLNNDPTGTSTAGLISSNGTVFSELPPNSEAFILGPVVDGFVPNHTSDAYTNIGYIQKDTRQFVLLARVQGQWKSGLNGNQYAVWGGTSTGFTSYNQNFTLQMAQWARDKILDNKYTSKVPYFYSGGVPQVPQGPADCPNCPPGMYGGNGIGPRQFGSGGNPKIGTEQGNPKFGNTGDANLYGIKTKVGPNKMTDAKLYKLGLYRGSDGKMYPLPNDKPVPYDAFDPLNLAFNYILGRFGLSGLAAFQKWANKGKNQRISDEDVAGWARLWADDQAQKGQSDAAFARGDKPGLLGRPDQAFNPFRSAAKGGPSSGPTPLIRQAASRATPPAIAASGQSIQNGKGDFNQKSGSMDIKVGNQRITKSYPTASSSSTPPATPAPTGRPEGAIFTTQKSDAFMSGFNQEAQRTGMPIRDNWGRIISSVPSTPPATIPSPTKPTPQQNAEIEKQIKQLQADNEKLKANQVARNWQLVGQLGMDALTLLTLFDPIPGDEAAVLGARTASEVAKDARNFQRLNPGKYNPFQSDKTNALARELGVGADVKAPRAALKNSYKPEGQVLSENRQRILREIKKPYVLPEIPKEKYKMNFSGKYSAQNTPDKTACKLSDDLIASGNARGEKWRIEDKYWQGYETTERMNIIYDRIGHGDQYFDRIIDENQKKVSWKNREIQEHLNILSHEKVMKKENLNYESPFGKQLDEQETLQADKDPLFKRVSKKLKPIIDYPDKPSKAGYPNDPPPEMVNGWHPEYGKDKGYYNKLDSKSAGSMPTTGNPEIDKKVEKARRQPK